MRELPSLDRGSNPRGSTKNKAAPPEPAFFFVAAGQREGEE